MCARCVGKTADYLTGRIDALRGGVTSARHIDRGKDPVTVEESVEYRPPKRADDVAG